MIKATGCPHPQAAAKHERAGVNALTASSTADPERIVMNSIEQFQNHLKQQTEAAGDLAKRFQAIATAHADYAKKIF